MSLGILGRGKTVVAMASALLVVTSGLGLARQKEVQAPSEKARASSTEKIAGVILKAVPVSKKGKEKADGKKGAVPLRLSINTNAVWRDWVRDQSQTRDEGPAKKDAAKGANSVATKGEPTDDNSLVVIDVVTETRIETRFRSPTDDTTKGVTTPEKVAADDGTTSKKTSTAKPVQFRAEDLLPGLYVEVEYRHSDAQNQKTNRASTVTVIRPITVLDTSPTSPPTPKK
jgi:hypothetical protein